MGRGGGILAALAAASLVLPLASSSGNLTGTQAGTSLATSSEVHFTAVGDYAAFPASTGPVLEGIAAAAPDAHFALGDLSYGQTGAEQAWCDFVTQRVGAGFPFELLAGNHESNGINGNINDFSACLPNQLPGLVGTYGRQYYVDVPAENPLVRFVMISPDITFHEGRWTYDAGTARHSWTVDTIDDARDTGIPWIVAGIHKPCLSVGEYGCTIGSELVNMLMAKQVDLVLFGHEHNYQRTKQLDLGPGCSALVIGSYSPDCVADADNDLVAGEGTVFATIGTGGVSQRAVHTDDAELPYFASTAGAGTNPVYGFGDFMVTPNQIAMTFESVNSAFSDGFTLTRPETPPTPVAPTAAFTSSTDGQRVLFDGSSSTDPDGVIVNYDWRFGDGTRGGGATPTHQYAGPGTYDVTLIVTDDEGATSAVTHQVTVTQGVANLATDTFTRTVTNAWGSTDTGHPWSIAPTTSGTWAVGGGVGTINLQAAGGTAPSAYLKTVSSDDLDMSFQLSVSKVPTGGGRVDQKIVLRRRANDHYRAVLQLLSTGAVKALFARTVAGANTNLTSVTTIPGLTYTAGAQLQVRAQATGTSPTTLRLKVWPVGAAEPTAWALTVQDSSASMQGPGYAGVSPFLSPNTTNAPIQVRYDNLRLATASALP